MKARRDDGESIDAKDIKKHRQDVLRISAELVLNEVMELPESVHSDIKRFIDTLEQDPFDQNSLRMYGLTNDEVVTLLKRVFA